jgi:integrase
LRAQALMLVGWSTLLRRSELVARTRRDWHPTPDGDDGLLQVARTKGKKRVQERYVIPRAREKLDDWLGEAGLTAAGIAEDHPAFPRLNRNGVVSRRRPKALHPGEVNLVYKDAGRRAGLSELEVKRIAGHSTRIGATHALAANGASLLQVQQAGGWDSPQMPALYLRQQAAREGAMAQWARDQDPALATPPRPPRP